MNEISNPYAKYLAQEEQPAEPIDTPSNPYAKYLTLDKDEAPVEMQTGEWASWDSVQGARLFTEGMTLGWGDEIGLGIAAAAAAATTGTDYSTVYATMKERYNAQKQQFKQDNGALATGLELAGGLASPLNTVRMGSGLVGMARVGAGQGAIAGAGFSDSTDAAGIAADASMGAVVGGALGGVLGGGSWVMKRRVSKELGKGDDFIPLTLAAEGDGVEGLIHTIYRDIVSPSHGAKDIMSAQASKVIDPIETAQRIRMNRFRAVKAAASHNIDKLKTALKIDIDDLATKRLEDAAGITDDVAIKKAMIDGNYSMLLGESGPLIARRTREIAEHVDKTESSFRLQAVTESLPIGGKGSAVEDILQAENPNVAMAKLDKLWSDVGFQSIKITDAGKPRSFRMKPSALREEIETLISKDPSFEVIADTKGSITSRIDSIITAMENRTDARGFMRGDDLADLRASFGTAAAAMGDTGDSLVSKLLFKNVQKVVDDKMLKQLSGKAKDAFELDRSRWATNAVLKDAILAASKKAGRYGRFTPDEWLAAISGNSTTAARRGQGALFNEAQATHAIITKGEEAILTSSKELATKIAARREKELNRLRSKAVAEKLSLRAKTKANQNTLAGSSAKAQEQAKDLDKLSSLEAEIWDFDSLLSNMNAARGVQNPTWYHSMAATQAAGSPVSQVPLPWAAKAVGALTLGRKLASENAQRIVAGQSDMQKAVQSAVASPMGQLLQPTATAAIRAPVGMMTGDNAPLPDPANGRF
jgi:hypothetical protein